MTSQIARITTTMSQWLTRKPCYRKDDRAMHPIYMDALKIFGSPWLRPRLLFSKLMGFCCDQCTGMCVQNLKFIGLSVSY